MSVHSEKDQAEELRTRMNEIENKDQNDILSLPPRKKVHGRKRKEKPKKEKQQNQPRFRLKFVIVRLLLVLFLVLVAIILTYPVWSTHYPIF